MVRDSLLDMANPPEVKATDVTILGGRYSVKSPYSAAFVEQTAMLVNLKLKEIMQSSGLIATDKIAILACLNLASELLKLQEESQSTRERLKKRLEKVLSSLDTCLSQEEIGYVSGNLELPLHSKQKDELVESSLPCA